MKDFILRRGVIEAISYLNKKNIKVFFVTNQAGIGKKLYSNKSYLISIMHYIIYQAYRKTF